MNRLIYNDHNHTYTDRETGETFPVECLDEYAQGKLDAAIKKLAEAWVGARARFVPSRHSSADTEGPDQMKGHP